MVRKVDDSLKLGRISGVLNWSMKLMESLNTEILGPMETKNHIHRVLDAHSITVSLPTDVDREQKSMDHP